MFSSISNWFAAPSNVNITKTQSNDNTTLNNKAETSKYYRNSKEESIKKFAELAEDYAEYLYDEIKDKKGNLIQTELTKIIENWENKHSAEIDDNMNFRVKTSNISEYIGEQYNNIDQAIYKVKIISEYKEEGKPTVNYTKIYKSQYDVKDNNIIGENKYITGSIGFDFKV